ncbi:hypothetical protein ABB37_09740 [Leptomonas pyrrhocoris]|uniref:GPR1/FUN34/yaaH family n=1 Tax=Leptomonas pyrrhocoris TaxID=157538 RepID=A0A0N0VCV5_LEPPY|nr:hypothetical protein ABB37_09740 [Leptomonas pyrrhocoris]KPA73608.1 hypothetical protein ABB37_09740 [Leptomonas pyrrhocoris]|eukprot:XP_015652047.1 hypothetical protein ABB37_09740 [Leptomonas pyrrhocoris]
MTDKDAVFAEGEVTCVSREPTQTSHGYTRLDTADNGAPSQRCRRPRKVVVYYFDSDVEGEGEQQQPAAAGNTLVRPRPSSTKREGGTKKHSRTGVSDTNTPEAEKLDYPGVEELEAYSSEMSHANAHSGAAAGASCGCGGGGCQSRRPVSVDNPRIGSPTPIGFFAFGMTTLIYNVHNAKICQLNMATMGLVVMFGGLTQFICGFFELINMNTLGCTISTTYGAFWLATAVLFLEPANAYVTMGDHTYTGGFFLLWFVFAGTLFAASFRSPFMCMALFFLVPLNFLLQSIGYFMDSTGVAKVAGYEGMIVGALATYLGMAFTLRDVYGRSLLPILFQKNMRYVEW